MTDSESARIAEAPARAAALIADFMTRHDAWQKQAADLARGRERVRVAAQREAADVVARTRADINGTLADARRGLLMLAAQVLAVDEPHERQKPTGLRQFFDESGTAAQQSEPDPSKTRSRTNDRHPAPANPASLFGSSTAPQRTVVTNGEKVGHRRRAARVVIVVAAFVVTALSIVGWRVAVAARGPAPGPVAAATPPTPASSTRPPPVDAPATPRAAEQSIARNAIAADRRTWLWLVIDARRSAWIDVTTDGRAEQRRFLQAGEGRRILANESISIAAGDGGAVTFALNGVPPATLGRDGQRVTRRFTMEDAEQIIASRANGSIGLATTGGVEETRGRPAVATGNPELDILTLSQRWLDAYYRGDNNTMAYVAAPDAKVVDVREMDDRMPKGVPQVSRSFEELQFEQHSGEATLVGRMTEEGDIRGVPAHAVAIVSEQWRNDGNRWRLTEVRIVATAK